NGSGKSTLLKILAGLTDFEYGKIEYNQKNVVLSPQEPIFLKGTLYETLLESFKWAEIPFCKEKLEKLLVEFELEKLKNSDIKSLSGGERAKAQLVRTILYDKSIVLLDEPTASLDKRSSLLVEQKILELKKDNKLIIMITHDLEEAFRVSDFIYEIDRGELVLKKEILNEKNRCL
ncbi:MAG: ATP-binding cassette domain-containing protein, partial [Cetobacterium sp.]